MFKPGDVVIYRHNAWDGVLTTGKEYVVQPVESWKPRTTTSQQYTQESWTYIIRDDNGEVGGYYNGSFKLVVKAKRKKKQDKIDAATDLFGLF